MKSPRPLSTVAAVELDKAARGLRPPVTAAELAHYERLLRAAAKKLGPLVPREVQP